MCVQQLVAQGVVHPGRVYEGRVYAEADSACACVFAQYKILAE